MRLYRKNTDSYLDYYIDPIFVELTGDVFDYALILFPEWQVVLYNGDVIG